MLPFEQILSDLPRKTARSSLRGQRVKIMPAS